MRRFKQRLSEAEAIDILKNNSSGVLSVVDTNGKPYGVPLNYAFVNGRILFHCAKAGRKLEAIDNCSFASFCVVHQDSVCLERFANDYVSVIVEGDIHRLENSKEAIECFMDAYVPRDYPGLTEEIEAFLPQLVMLELIPESITGKESKYMMEQRSKKK